MVRRLSLAAAVLAVGLTHEAGASIAYNAVGSAYTQNFDSLPNGPTNTSLGASPLGWTDDNAAPGVGNFSIVGVYLRHSLPQGVGGEGGFNERQRMRIGAGTVNTGSFWSFGAAGSTERALGFVGSNTMSAVGTANNYALRFTNNTGVTLTQFTLSYNGEQWRDGGAAQPVAQSVTFSYSVGATAINDAGFIAVPALNFTSPVFVNTGSGAAVDGNAAGKVAIAPASAFLTWAPGTDLWVRWSDVNDTGNDHGLAIDDLAFSAQVAVPEASPLALMGLVGSLGTAATLWRRRRVD